MIFNCFQNPYVYQKNTLRTGFEPVRVEPNGFQVHLLNHSDTAAHVKVVEIADYITRVFYFLLILVIGFHLYHHRFFTINCNLFIHFVPWKKFVENYNVLLSTLKLNLGADVHEEGAKSSFLSAITFLGNKNNK